jgi:hypothetical protein
LISPWKALERSFEGFSKGLGKSLERSFEGF